MLESKFDENQAKAMYVAVWASGRCRRNKIGSNFHELSPTQFTWLLKAVKKLNIDQVQAQIENLAKALDRK